MSEETKAICQEIAEGYKALAEEIHSAVRAGDEARLEEIATECADLHYLTRKEMRLASAMEDAAMVMLFKKLALGREQRKVGVEE